MVEIKIAIVSQKKGLKGQDNIIIEIEKSVEENFVLCG